MSTKINDYKLELLENGNGKLTIYKGTTPIEVQGEIENLKDLTAGEVTERVLVELKARDFELVKKVEQEEFMIDQRTDLNLCRVKMRQILKDLSDPSISIESKKNVLPIAAQICSAAQIVVNSCKLELAMINATKGLKK